MNGETKIGLVWYTQNLNNNLQIIYIVFNFAQEKKSLGNDRSMGRITHLNNERITSTPETIMLWHKLKTIHVALLFIYQKYVIVLSLFN